VVLNDGSRAGLARSRLRRWSGGLLAGTLVGAAVLLVFENTAVADPSNLSAVFLSSSLPGFFADPSGATNGPIDASSLKSLGVSENAASTLGQQIADGNVSGYIRTWRRKPPDGDAAVISAFSFQNEPDLSEFTAGEADAAARAGGVRFAVPGVSGASGYTVRADGTTAFVVIFTKAGLAFQVDVLDASHQLAASDAASLARRQTDAVPSAFQAPAVGGQTAGGQTAGGQTAGGQTAGGQAAAVQAAGAKGSHPGGSFTDRDGKLVGGSLLAVVLAAGVVLTLRRRRRGNRVTTGPKAGADSPVGPGRKISPAEPSWLPSPSSGRPVGWYPAENDPDEKDYWDGQAWSARKRRIGETWVDVPTADVPTADVATAEDPRRAQIELEVCVWQEVGSRSDRLADPSDEAVEEAIRKLDGSTRNDLYLRAPGGQWMCVGGGPGRVIVTFAGGPGGPFYQALSSSEEDGEDVQIRVGGQPVWMPARTLVAEDDAIAAAMEFVRTSDRPSSLAWTP
jgi:immunity protein Imm1 of predicted polymorphic toxin system